MRPDRTPREESFGTELRRLRGAAALTMEQLAEASGVSARTISDMERGRTRTPQRRTVAMLAGALHLNARDRERLEVLTRDLQALAAPQAVPASDRSDLLGRESELAELESALHSAKRLRGTALVLRAGPGLGKTALLREAEARGSAHPLTALSVTGVATETHLPFTGLRQLLEPLLGGEEPGTGAARRLILQAAGEGEQPEDLDPYQVALAALTLVTWGPRQPARLLLVDDAQWLDRQSWDSIAFLARRIATQPVTVIMAMRDSTETDIRLGPAGLPELRIPPLDPASSAALVDRTAPDLPSHLRARVLAEAAGHPLALIDLPTAITGTGWQPAASTALPLSDRLKRSYTSAMDALPTPVQTALQVAALHDGDSTDEILAAAGALLGEECAAVVDLGPALDAHLVAEAQGRTRFRHPLIRDAVGQGIPAPLRRRIHTAIAQVMGPRTDRGVWHRAAGATGADEDLAQDLADLAVNLRGKGAFAAAARSWERASELTVDPQKRATHLYWALQMVGNLGDVDQIRRFRGMINAADIPFLLRANYLKSLENHLQDGWTPASDLAALPASVSLAHAQGETDTAADALLLVSHRCFWTPPDARTRATLIACAEGLGLPPLDRRLLQIRALIAPLERGRIALETIAGVLREPSETPGEAQSLGIAVSAVGDQPAAKTFLTADIARYRAQGALGNLGESLVSHAYVAAQLSEVGTALSCAREAQLLTGEVGRPFWALAARMSEAQAEALCGNSTLALSMADHAERSLLAHGPNPLLALIQLARGTAYLAQGRPADAYDALVRVMDPNDPSHHHYSGLAAMPHIAEAGGSSPQRREHLRTLVDATQATADLCGWPPLLIGLAQAKAYLAEDDDADQAFTAALNTIPGSWAFERARTQLAYGSWLRRNHRADESRPHVQAALHTFRALATAPWTQRARAEFRAGMSREPEGRGLTRR